MRYFLGLGIWGFGGPIATVGYMQRDLVGRRQWIDRGEFLDGVALGQTMPGPLAASRCGSAFSSGAPSVRSPSPARSSSRRSSSS
ncbi:MAG: chromate transporter [Actinobacteria bacterium]|nr:chromate transporter [Actinomycetota bacterium]